MAVAATALTSSAAFAQDDEDPSAPRCQEQLRAFAGISSEPIQCENVTSVRVSAKPAHGRVDTHDPSTEALPFNGVGRYVPAAGYLGFDAFTLEVTATDGSTSQIQIQVLVEPLGGGAGSGPTCNAPNLEETSFVRTNTPRTSTILCLNPTPLVALPPRTTEDAGAGSASVGEAERIDLNGITGYAYAVQFRPAPSLSAGDTVQLTVRGAGQDPIEIEYDVIDADEPNLAPECFGANSFGGVAGLGAGIELQFGSCLDPEGDPISVEQVGGGGTVRRIVGDNYLYTTPETTGTDTPKLVATDAPPAPLTAETDVIESEPYEVVPPRCSVPALTLPAGGAATQTITCPDAVAVQTISSSLQPIGGAADHGSVEIAPGATPDTRQLTYTVDPGYSGPDAFLMVVSVRPEEEGADPTLELQKVSVDVLAPPVPETPAQPQPQPQPPAPPVVSEKDRVLALIKGTGLKAVMKSVRAALAKNKAKASIASLAYNADIAVKLTAKVGKKKAVKQGSGRLSLFKNRKGTLKLSLTKAAKKTLKRKGKLKVTVQLTLTNPDTGAKASLKQGVTIKAPKPKKRKKR